ncbi:endonuclease/exonuclease/phosphatase family protein [Candidatus Sumerlaeota bacterium]|nr:endonuclease/exonuclease/phosphatase family protein [Candidatus Sumerlaeota bacterium]
MQGTKKKMVRLRSAIVIFFIVFLLVCLTGCTGLLTSQVSPQTRSEKAISFRILTYNIHIGKGMDGRLSLNRIARVINTTQPDLVALQEVDRFTQRSNKIDEIKILEELTRMKGVYGKTIDYQGGEYGIAVLSNCKILSSYHSLLPEFGDKERRGFLTVYVEKDHHRIAFINTHLGLDSEERRVQIETLLKASRDIQLPLIIAGDFNEEPQTENWQVINSIFIDTAQALKNEQFTFPADNPVRRIDYIWLRRNDNWRPVRCQVFSTLASDHLPFLAEIELLPPGFKKYNR